MWKLTGKKTHKNTLSFKGGVGRGGVRYSRSRTPSTRPEVTLLRLHANTKGSSTPALPEKTNSSQCGSAVHRVYSAIITGKKFPAWDTGQIWEYRSYTNKQTALGFTYDRCDWVQAPCCHLPPLPWSSEERKVKCSLQARLGAICERFLSKIFSTPQKAKNENGEKISV